MLGFSLRLPITNQWFLIEHSLFPFSLPAMFAFTTCTCPQLPEVCPAPAQQGQTAGSRAQPLEKAEAVLGIRRCLARLQEERGGPSWMAGGSETERWQARWGASIRGKWEMAAAGPSTGDHAWGLQERTGGECLAGAHAQQTTQLPGPVHCSCSWFWELTGLAQWSLLGASHSAAASR